MPTNIAEGSNRHINAEYARFLNIAECSLAETAHLRILSRDIEYLSAGRVAPLLADADEVARMLHRYG